MPVVQESPGHAPGGEVLHLGMMQLECMVSHPL